MKDCRTIEERAKDFEKVYVFSIVNSARKNYKDIEEFKQVYSTITKKRASKNQQVKFCSLFGGLDRKDYRIILGHEIREGKIHHFSIREVEPYFSKWFHYRRHFTFQHLDSGKPYSVHGYFYIDFDVLERFWNNKDVILANSSFYTKLQHMFIDSLILRGCVMTKKEEREYQEAYERGEKNFSLEDYKKDLRKKKRSEDKRRLTIAKKAARETLSELTAEIAKKELEILKLQSENNMLKQQKDLNSDVPEDVVVQKKKIEYDELDKLFPDGIDPEKVDWNDFSDDCINKLKEEYEAERKLLERPKDIQPISPEVLDAITREIESDKNSDIVETEDCIVSLNKETVVTHPEDDIPDVDKERDEKLILINTFLKNNVISLDEAKFIAGHWYINPRFLVDSRLGATNTDFKKNKEKRISLWKHMLEKNLTEDEKKWYSKKLRFESR